MAHAKGTSVPFFSPTINPRLRDEALVRSALRAWEAGETADALIAAEAASRRQPRNPIPALLAARYAAEAFPALAAGVFYRAWLRAPEDHRLQDAMLEQWLRDGAAASVRALAPAFLPRRLRDGTQESLLALLRRAGARQVGACWREGATIAGRVFHLQGRAPSHLPLKLVAQGLDGADVSPCEVPADGQLFNLHPPHPARVWSLAFTGADGRLQPLAGSPLVWHDEPTPASATGPHEKRAGWAVAAMKQGHGGRKVAVTGTQQPVIDIVIPVYRDAERVVACIDSVLASLAQNRMRAELVVIDDAGPEPALSRWLDEQAAQGRITLLRNRCNLGFIETANRGLQLHPQRDVVLLNADTQVHGDWLDRLAASLAAADDIAAVTAWSNNSEITSLPRIGRAAEAPEAAVAARIDAAAAQLQREGRMQDQDLPSCCGYVMLMRRAAIERVGLFDGAAFNRGYSEEVDWCLRARAVGYRHRLSSGVFIAHAGSTSFGLEKQLRVQQNRAVIQARHPGYYPEYHAFLRDDPLAPQRAPLLRAVARCAADWLAQAQREAAPHTGLLPQPLPSACRRIPVLGLRAASPAARSVLALARQIAASQRPVRLLVIGEISEALWHTGVVDGMPESGDSTVTLIPDAVLIGAAGCDTVLDASGNAGAGVAGRIALDSRFDPAGWYATWCARTFSVATRRRVQDRLRA